MNDFFVSLIEHTRHDHRYALQWWANEQRATAECTGLARPDGLGLWTRVSSRGEDELAFFLEHDTGTEPLARLLSKLPGYAEARLGGGPAHPVLFWLPSHQREAHLHDLLRQRPAPVPVATAVRDGAGPADRIWLVSGTQRRYELIDLAALLPRTRDHAGPLDDERAA